MKLQKNTPPILEVHCLLLLTTFICVHYLPLTDYTSLATILGLIPIALGLGEGSEAMSPMGVVVVFGLALSTFSTLLLVPVIYTIFEDIRTRGFRRRKKGKLVKASEITHQV